MDKYAKRRTIVISSLLAAIGIGGFHMVKNISESEISNNSQEVYAVCDDAVTYSNVSGARTTEVTTTYVTTASTTYTSEDTHLYTQPCERCGNITSGTGVYLTEYEVQLLSTLVYLEGGTESFECQKAIASTVINRMVNSGDTLIEVVYADNQYSVVSMLDSSSPSESAKDAVTEVLNNGVTIPTYVTFFRADYYHDWGDQVPYCNIDNTYFTYSQAMLDEYKEN